MRIFLAAMAIAVSVGSPAHGQTYTVGGPGAASCGTWSAERRQDSIMVEARLSWILGWLSSASYRGNRDLLRDRDNDSLKAWLDNYCTAHPLEYVSDATIALELELARTAPPPSR